jgi:hypothetical protein
VQSEPWLERDKAMIDPIKSLGIEKGRPFNPDATSRAALKDFDVFSIGLETRCPVGAKPSVEI